MDVLVEGFLPSDGLRGAGGLHGPVVEAVGQGDELRRHAVTQCTRQSAPVGGSQLPDGFEAEGGKAGLRFLSDAENAADRERREDPLRVLGVDDHEAVGLFHVGSELRQEFVRRDADGGSQARFLADGALDRLAVGAGAVHQPLHAREVEESLVDGKLLDDRGEPREDGEDLPRHGAVFRVVAGQENGVGAAAARRDHGHRRVYAEFPRLVRGGGDDAPRPQPADDDGLPAIFLMVALLHGGEERVHVDMKNDAFHTAPPLCLIKQLHCSKIQLRIIIKKG